jgi:carboxylesterase type B
MNSPERKSPDPGVPGIGRRSFLTASAAAAVGVTMFEGLAPASQAATLPSRSEPGQPVPTQSGWVTGIASALAGVTVYKGIPYAGSTAGNNRFAPPPPAPSWRGVRKADTWGPACPQPVQGIPADQVPVLSEESCLNLNVWTGATSRDERRPVFVWLYGGRGSAMWTSQPIYDGAGLARKGLVVVTVNYRVGAFGGLATAELSKDSGHSASGNWALLDQVAALKWVQRNIAAFGGDPDRVTLAGWSHGAASTYDLIDSPLAAGLFQRAQLESGVEYTKDPAYGHVASGYSTLAEAEAQGAAFEKLLGVSTTAQLRALPAATIAQASNNPSVPEFRYVLDGYVMPRSFDGTLQTRSQNDVPVLTGNNKDENGVSLTQAVSLADYKATAGTMFGSQAGEFLALYPAATDAEANAQSNAFDRDYERVSTFLWGTQWLAAGSSPAYTYYWTHAAPGTDSSSPIAAGIQAAGHGSEMNYIFNNLYGTDRPWAAADYRVADELSDYVVNFATTGDPNRGHRHGRPYWPALRSASPTVMEVGDAFHPITAADSPAKYQFIKRWLETQTVDW